MILPILRFVTIVRHSRARVVLFSNIEVGAAITWVCVLNSRPIFYRLHRQYRLVMDKLSMGQVKRGSDLLMQFSPVHENHDSDAPRLPTHHSIRDLENGSNERPASRLMLPYEREANEFPMPELSTVFNETVYSQDKYLGHCRAILELEG